MADLCHRCALHLACDRAEGVHDPLLPRTAAYELVAACNRAGDNVCISRHLRRQYRLNKMLVCRKVDHVDSGNQSDRIPERRGIHVVLHQIYGQCHITDRQRIRQGTADPGVDNRIRVVGEDHCLRTQCGKYLANPTYRDHGVMST